MMLTDFVFQVPSEFATAYQANQLSRFGGLLKDSGTGKIVGHLQESGVSNQVMNSFIGGPLASINTVSSLAANAQLIQIKGMLEMMQIFQFATLGASIAGLGVSAVGFAVLNKKINSISATVNGLEEKIDDSFRELFKARIRDAISDLKGTIAVAEHKFALGETGAEWDSLGKRLMEKSERFRGELEFMLSSKSIDQAAFDSMLDALCLSNSSAGKAFLLANNLRSARHHAEKVSKGYDALFDEITPVSLSKKLIVHAKDGTPPSDGSAAIELARNKIQYIRDIQETASTLPYLIETLREKQVSGVDYVTAIQNDDRAPLLVLAA